MFIRETKVFFLKNSITLTVLPLPAAVDAEGGVVLLDLGGLDLGEGADGVQPGVLRQGQRHRLQGVGEGPERVLLDRLDLGIVEIRIYLTWESGWTDGHFSQSILSVRMSYHGVCHWIDRLYS